MSPIEFTWTVGSLQTYRIHKCSSWVYSQADPQIQQLLYCTLSAQKMLGRDGSLFRGGCTSTGLEDINNGADVDVAGPDLAPHSLTRNLAATGAYVAMPRQRSLHSVPSMVLGVQMPNLAPGEMHKDEGGKQPRSSSEGVFLQAPIRCTHLLYP